jgi:hypothetical protein
MGQHAAITWWFIDSEQSGVAVMPQKDKIYEYTFPIQEVWFATIQTR